MKNCYTLLLLCLSGIYLNAQTVTPFGRVYTTLNTKCQNSTCHSATASDGSQALRFDGSSNAVHAAIFDVVSSDSSSVSKFEKIVRIEIGGSAIYTPIQFRLKLTSFKTYKTECAVPGFNCGAGYMPEPKTFPIFETSVAKQCAAKKGPLPKECEVAYTVVGTDNAKFVELKFHSIFAPCEQEPNIDNRNSCFRLATKNSIYKPAFNIKNCDRIQPPENRKICYKEVGDKLSETFED